MKVNNGIIIACLVVLILIVGCAAFFVFGSAGKPVSASSANLTIYGYVLDHDNVQIPGSTATLYQLVYDPSTGGYTNKLVSMENNPQEATSGLYSFANIIPGRYNVIASMGGQSNNTVVDVNSSVNGSNSYNVSVSLPGYTYMPVGSLSPAPVKGPWAEIAGQVTDMNGLPLANATVTLLAMGLDASGNYVNLGMAQVSDNPFNNSSVSANPVLTSDGTMSETGSYVFYKVPWGKYNITVEYNGKLWWSTVILGPKGSYGTVTCNPCEAGDYGDVSGSVISNNVNMNASVAIYNTTYDNATGTYLTGDLLNITGNPQWTNSSSQPMPGTFTFYVVPIGTYKIVADANGQTGSTIADMNQTNIMRYTITIPEATNTNA